MFEDNLWGRSTRPSASSLQEIMNEKLLVKHREIEIDRRKQIKGFDLTIEPYNSIGLIMAQS